MTYQVVVRPHVAKQLKDLPKHLRSSIGYAIYELQDNPRPPGVKKLKGVKSPLYRIRVGDWRIIYTIEDKIVLVTVVGAGDRKDVYDLL